MLCWQKNIMKVFKLFILFLFTISACSVDVDSVASDCKNGKQVLLHNDSINKIFCVEIADNPVLQVKGLMGVAELPENYGMLFVYNGEDYRTFWMKNTLIPLDIIFFDQSGIMVDYKDNFMPCVDTDCDTYQSKDKAMYVLEINSDVLEPDQYIMEII